MLKTRLKTSISGLWKYRAQPTIWLIFTLVSKIVCNTWNIFLDLRNSSFGCVRYFVFRNFNRFIPNRVHSQARLPLAKSVKIRKYKGIFGQGFRSRCRFCRSRIAPRWKGASSKHRDQTAESALSKGQPVIFGLFRFSISGPKPQVQNRSELSRCCAVTKILLQD